jgi:ParB-like chromosome segregation protein Spo0J
MKPPYRYHPACLAFPMLPEAELRVLATNIRLRGLLHPIVCWRGYILDGRNRLAACELAGVAPRFVEWQGTDPVAYIVSENLHRRDLSASQRAVVALDLLPLLEIEAKERQRTGRLAHSCAKASEVAAELARSGVRYVEMAKALRAAAPDLIEHIRAGCLSIPNARRLASLPAPVRCKVLARVRDGELSRFQLALYITEARHEERRETIAPTSKDNNILVGDMAILWDRLGDASVDLFLTDPIYSDIPGYEKLAELAAAKLKPGGFCLAYASKIYLPEVMDSMAKHLQFWWLFSINYKNVVVPFHARGIKECWKPVLAYIKPPMHPAPEWFLDAVQGIGGDKDYHMFGKPEAEGRYFIGNLTAPGGLVVDPYAGGGAFCAAAKATGRRWLATERDRATALIARRRVQAIAGASKSPS